MTDRSRHQARHRQGRAADSRMKVSGGAVGGTVDQVTWLHIYREDRSNYKHSGVARYRD